MAGKYGPASVTVTYDDAPGGTGRSVEDFLLNGINAKQISDMFETTALGDSARERTPVGMEDNEINTLEGVWDTTGTTGTHVVFGSVDNGPQDATRTLVIVFGDSKTFTVETRLASYEVFAGNDGIQRFRAEIVCTGAGVWS